MISSFTFRYNQRQTLAVGPQQLKRFSVGISFALTQMSIPVGDFSFHFSTNAGNLAAVLADSLHLALEGLGDSYPYIWIICPEKVYLLHPVWLEPLNQGKSVFQSFTSAPQSCSSTSEINLPCQVWYQISPE